MANSDWNVIGKSIVDLVETAIDTNEFKQLNKTLNITISKALHEVNKGLNKVQEYRKQEKLDIHKDNRNYFIKINNQKAKAIIFMLLGILITFPIGISFLLSLVALFLSTVSFLPILLGVMTFIGLYIIMKSLSNYQMCQRYERYIASLKGKAYINIYDLTKIMDKDEKFIIMDLKKMINKKWFLQGHLDDEEKSFIVTDEMYQEYCQTIEIQLKQAAYEATIDPEIKDILYQGKLYLEEIRRCNDEIVGEEISFKIEKIEDVVRKIFVHLEDHPENKNDLRKFMKYYLPTTIKLLKAYQELDKQNIQGENIMNSKIEIEKTLDTLNLAFEKLLDDLFLDTSWDVSSDISVLNTMLVQEGLTTI